MPRFDSTTEDGGIRPSGGHRRGRIFRLAGDRRGSAAVEFAILAVPFFLTIFAIIETSIVFLAELTLDQSVDRVARKVRTGELQKANMTAEDFKKEICKGVEFLLDCSKLNVDIKVYPDFGALNQPTPVKNGDIDPSGFGYQLGGPETINALRVYYKWPIHTDMMRAYLSDMADGSHLLYSMAAFRTEPF
ncbi:pilus assembly protein TadG [Aureimonas sp. SA4125]|uniref:TadE/TadG family type IV pilus assembly protein n=1 Tax=Aureimonas sp. SA4125 TaxID=2826993 RepID=UPI001CC4A76A|nr:TadE/TadG family type IV pilus assembly protein [Aureimonas sp. SA4125]BDA82645.1 pilus assembly protein TadG [Aureimonas sp. SA4125]